MNELFADDTFTIFHMRVDKHTPNKQETSSGNTAYECEYFTRHHVIQDNRNENDDRRKCQSIPWNMMCC